MVINKKPNVLSKTEKQAKKKKNGRMVENLNMYKMKLNDIPHTEFCQSNFSDPDFLYISEWQFELCCSKDVLSMKKSQQQAI